MLSKPVNQLQSLKKFLCPKFAEPLDVFNLAKLHAFRVTWRNKTTGAHLPHLMQRFEICAERTNANHKRLVFTNIKVRLQVGLDQIRMYD